MRITANQVTFVRLLLLPVPIAMIYQGGTTWMVAALVVYVLLGLTDAVDGILARKYGSTPVGALLDPIVDKIFLVAAYGPMADIGWFPIYFLSGIFARELGVTFLRTVALEEQYEFKTSLLAKLKTSVQMAGAGFALLIWLFPERQHIMALFYLAVGISALPPLVQLLRGKLPGWKAWSGFGLIFAVALIRFLFDRERSLEILFGLILLITVYTGLEYLWGMRQIMLKRFRTTPFDLLRGLALALVIPVCWVPIIEFSEGPVMIVLAILAAELAIGGLDNSLAQYGRPRGWWSEWTRLTVQAICGLLAIWVVTTGLDSVYALGLGWLALFVTLSDFFVRLFKNYDAFAEDF